MPSYDVPTIFNSRERDRALADLKEAEAFALAYLLVEHFPAVFDDLLERVPSGRLYIAAQPQETPA